MARPITSPIVTYSTARGSTERLKTTPADTMTAATAQPTRKIRIEILPVAVLDRGHQDNRHYARCERNNGTQSGPKRT